MRVPSEKEKIFAPMLASQKKIPIENIVAFQDFQAYENNNTILNIAFVNTLLLIINNKDPRKLQWDLKNRDSNVLLITDVICRSNNMSSLQIYSFSIFK